MTEPENSCVPFMEGDSEPDRIIVSTCEFNHHLYVATQKGFYVLRDDKLHHIEMVEYKGVEK